jgi:hypothetical protein
MGAFEPRAGQDDPAGFRSHSWHCNRARHRIARGSGANRSSAWLEGITGRIAHGLARLLRQCEVICEPTFAQAYWCRVGDQDLSQLILVGGGPRPGGSCVQGLTASAAQAHRNNFRRSLRSRRSRRTPGSSRADSLRLSRAPSSGPPAMWTGCRVPLRPRPRCGRLFG